MLKTFALPFHKLSATGNDFLLLGLLKPDQQKTFMETFSDYTRPQLARLLCHRTEGVGADGLLFLERSEDSDYLWDFYNADGSQAEMCGNAARAAALWAQRQQPEKTSFTFSTLAGRVVSEILPSGLIRVVMPEAQAARESEQLHLGSRDWRYRAVNSGVPHAVIELDEAPRPDDLRAVARAFRSHQRFAPQGTNVTFFNATAKDRVTAVTFERGVEDFTRSCGTGAVAAAYVYAKGEPSSVQVQVPGGTLEVEVGCNAPYLTGPAHWVADVFIQQNSKGVFGR